MTERIKRLTDDIRDMHTQLVEFSLDAAELQTLALQLHLLWWEALEAGDIDETTGMLKGEDP